MILVLLFTGIPKKALFDLRVADLSWEEGIGWLGIFGDGVHRKIPIPDRLFILLAEFIEKCDISIYSLIFETKKGGTYSTSSFRKQVMYHSKRIGLFDGEYILKGNDYRIYFMNMMYKEGISIPVIREYMGYQDEESVIEQIGYYQNMLNKKNEEYFNGCSQEKRYLGDTNEEI